MSPLKMLLSGPTEALENPEEEFNEFDDARRTTHVHVHEFHLRVLARE